MKLKAIVLTTILSLSGSISGALANDSVEEVMAQVEAQLEAQKNARSCRDLIVEVYASAGQSMERDSFSTTTFEALNISVEDFNQMDSSDQAVIYQQITPIEVMVEGAIAKLNRTINQYVGTFYEAFMTDEIQIWRAQRDALRNCEK